MVAMFIQDQIKSVTKWSLIADVWPLWHSLQLMVKIVADYDFSRNKVIKEPIPVNMIFIVLPFTQTQAKFVIALWIVATNHFEWLLRQHEKAQICLIQIA